jgi:hypothetical protein
MAPNSLEITQMIEKLQDQNPSFPARAIPTSGPLR